MNLSRLYGNILNVIVIVTIEKKLVSVNGYFRKAGRELGELELSLYPGIFDGFVLLRNAESSKGFGYFFSRSYEILRHSELSYCALPEDELSRDQSASFLTTKIFNVFRIWFPLTLHSIITVICKER